MTAGLDLGDMDLSAPHVPGNARKWQVLQRLDGSAVGLTTRDFADIYGWDGTQPGADDARNGSAWQTALSHCATDLRYLHERKLIRYAGKLAEGWGKGNPAVWMITPKGRRELDVVDERRARFEVTGTVRGQRDKRRAVRLAERERTDALIAEVKAQHLQRRRPLHREQRQQMALSLYRQGCTTAQIADIFGVTAECIRLDVREAQGIRRTTKRV